MDTTNQVNDAVKNALKAKTNRRVEVDVERYQDFLDDPALTAVQREEIIRALWSIMTAFVELGFGIHPVQQACGKPGTELEQTSKSESTGIDLNQHIHRNEGSPQPWAGEKERIHGSPNSED